MEVSERMAGVNYAFQNLMVEYRTRILKIKENVGKARARLKKY